MSLRAIKKRDIRSTLSKKPTTGVSATSSKRLTSPKYYNTKTQYSAKNTGHLKQQTQLLGRLTRSDPELTLRSPVNSQEVYDARCLIRSKSEGENIGVLKSVSFNKNIAKSEVCLQSISARSYKETTSDKKPLPQSSMLTRARSHRDVSQSDHLSGPDINYLHINTTPRRMSECSLSYSQSSRQTGSMFASQLTISSSSTTPADPNAVLRVPIIGYEVMEERARFTVYKLRVENPVSNDCWLVLRRYTDFVRLNSKLKHIFPNLALLLPRKKLFGDNFNSVFLDNRVQGLQIFVNSIMAKEELRKCKLVREFFCLDEPPSYSESMEECRAIFEAQEETISHLKMQIQHKNDMILGLQQKLRDEIAEKEQLKDVIRNTSINCSNCSSANTSTALH